MIPSGTRFIGIAESVNLVERKTNGLNSLTQPYTFDEIRGYKSFTALLTQSGGSDELYLSESPLVVGTTYLIGEGDGGDDFTNVGAPNSNNGTSFIATGTTPANWAHNSILYYNSGAPVVTVLENTIGNIWFAYQQDGIYNIFSDGLFTENKTLSFIGTTNDNASPLGVFEIYCNSTSQIQLLTFDMTSSLVIDQLSNTPIEIRVYN
jgi:hypothetical protein